MTQRTCTLDGCDNRHAARGLCKKHYYASRRSGQLELLEVPTEAERFMVKVEKTDTCWNWTALTNQHGYGRFHVREGDSQRMLVAHRYSYELHVGPIPAGLILDHLCHNRACVNPEHLRVVTYRQNGEHREGVPRGNTSGVMGVTWETSMNCWRGVVQRGGRRIWNEYFTNLSDAAKAVREARNELFTHNDRDRV